MIVRRGVTLTVKFEVLEVSTARCYAFKEAVAESSGRRQITRQDRCAQRRRAVESQQTARSDGCSSATVEAVTGSSFR